LPEDAAFELDAESGSGGINIEHPLTVQGKISKRHLSVISWATAIAREPTVLLEIIKPLHRLAEQG